MHKRIAIGLIVLIFILGVAIVFYHQYTDIQQLKKEAAEAEKMLDEKDKPVTENKPPPAREGYKMVPHGDHWHEVPMTASDVSQDAPTTQPVQAAQEYKAYTGPLTFHKELLETNPLEALRLQCEERGHWSAKWITDYFSPDDLEAQAFAKTVYLRMYYNTLYRTTGKIPISDAEYTQLGAELDSHFEAIHAIPNHYRGLALMRISWPFLPPDREPTLNAAPILND